MVVLEHVGNVLHAWPALNSIFAQFQKVRADEWREGKLKLPVTGPRHKPLALMHTIKQVSGAIHPSEPKQSEPLLDRRSRHDMGSELP